MTTTSLLSQQTVDGCLRIARQNLAQDGSLQPILFVRTVGDRTRIIPLTLPDTFEAKARLFVRIGCDLSEQALEPSAALFLCESWIVAAQEAPSAMDFPPSEHPAREEAIVAIGRSADNSRYSQVVQPFKRDKHNRPVWQPVPIAVYEETPSQGVGSAGLLDCLFEAIAAHA